MKNCSLSQTVGFVVPARCLSLFLCECGRKAPTLVVGLSSTEDGPKAPRECGFARPLARFLVRISHASLGYLEPLFQNHPRFSGHFSCQLPFSLVLKQRGTAPVHQSKPPRFRHAASVSHSSRTRLTAFSPDQFLLLFLDTALLPVFARLDPVFGRLPRLCPLLPSGAFFLKFKPFSTSPLPSCSLHLPPSSKQPINQAPSSYRRLPPTELQLCCLTDSLLSLTPLP